MPVALLGSKYFKIFADFKYSHKVNVSIMNYFKSDSSVQGDLKNASVTC